MEKILLSVKKKDFFSLKENDFFSFSLIFEMHVIMSSVCKLCHVF